MLLRPAHLLPAFFFLACGQGSPSQEAPPRPGVAAVSSESSLQVKAIASAGKDAAPLTVQSSEAAPKEATPGQTIQDGSTLKTSPTARASFSTPELKRLELNSDTQLEVSLQKNSLKLSQGEVFLEAPKLPRGTLRIELPQGSLTTEGAAVNIRNNAQSTEINVLRGTVRLTGNGEEVTLSAAERGILSSEGKATKGPASDFSLITEWTLALQRAVDQPSSQPTDEEIPPPGFGTLKAKTPGTTKERPFRMLSQEVRVTITDQIARTEVEEVFENPSDVVVEGSFRFTLPEGASITRYAMYVKDKLMEGEIVDRDEGRKILKEVIDEYLEEQAKLRDPALTEWTQGNTFSTRIFPIMPREKKRVILAYTQRLDSQEGVTRYIYPLAAAGAKDKVEQFRFEASVSSSSGQAFVSAPLFPVKLENKERAIQARFEASQFQAPADFVLEIKNALREKARLATSAAKGEDSYFLLSLQPDLFGEVQAKARDWILLFDTSQSRTLSEMSIQRALLPVFLGALNYSDRVKVLAYDYTTREVTSGWAEVSDTLGAQLAQKLGAIEPAGATNLSLALETAAKASEGRPVKVVLFGDLSPTVGEIRPEVLSQTAKKILPPGSTVSAVGVGSSVDELVLEALPRALGGVSHRVSDGEDLGHAAIRILSSELRPVLSDISLSINGVETRDVYPRQLESLPVGKELVVVGRYQSPGEASITLKGRLGASPFEQKYTARFGEGAQGNSFIAPLWAKEKINFLTQLGDEASRKEVVTLSKAMGVMSRYTSFIVLENDAMYKEFGVEQQAKARQKEAAATPAPADATITYDTIEPEPTEGEEAPAAATPKPETASPKAAAPAMKPEPAKTDADSTLRPFNKKGKSIDALDAPFDEGGGGGGGGDYRRPVCKAVFSTNFKVGAPKPSEADETKLAELRATLAKDPLVRSSHQKLVSKLMSMGRYPEALDAALVWRKYDSANMGLLQTLGELYRLGGRPEEAVRITSGALDIDPENKEVVEILASYALVKGHPQEAYALRLGRALHKPNDPAVQLELAEAASQYGLYEEVLSLLSSWVEVDAKGKVSVKAKLTSAQKTKALKLYSEALGASTSKTPRSLGSILAEAPNKANLVAELTWEGDADLDLWVVGSKGRPVFGEGFLEDHDGAGPERLSVEKAKFGRYRVQVFDASTRRGTAEIKGKVVLYGFKGTGSEKKKEISFTLQPGGGLELGSISILSRQECF